MLGRIDRFDTDCRMAIMVASRMFSRSMASESNSAMPKAGRMAFSSAASAPRRSGLSCLLSRTPRSTWPHLWTVSASSTAQAATTGPAQAPRPASSTPPQATPGGTLPRSQSRGLIME